MLLVNYCRLTTLVLNHEWVPPHSFTSWYTKTGWTERHFLLQLIIISLTIKLKRLVAISFGQHKLEDVSCKKWKAGINHNDGSQEERRQLFTFWQICFMVISSRLASFSRLLTVSFSCSSLGALFSILMSGSSSSELSSTAAAAEEQTNIYSFKFTTGTNVSHSSERWVRVRVWGFQRALKVFFRRDTGTQWHGQQTVWISVQLKIYVGNWRKWSVTRLSPAELQHQTVGTWLKNIVLHWWSQHLRDFCHESQRGWK